MNTYQGEKANDDAYDTGTTAVDPAGDRRGDRNLEYTI